MQGEQSSNPFIQHDQSHNEELERWGLMDLDLGAQPRVWHEVRNRIHNEKITDIDEQRRIADEVKMQYQEYQQTKQSAKAKKEIEVVYAKAESEDSFSKELKAAFDDLVRTSAITQLKEEIKALDERIKKLEKYTNDH